jgi:hypothetical protein
MGGSGSLDRGAAKAVGQLSEDDAGPQMPLGDVVGIGHRPVGHEHEQMGAVGAHALVQPTSRLSDRDRRDDPVQPAIEIIQILLQGGVLQRRAPSSHRDGAQQQPPERRAERRVTAVDGVRSRCARQTCHCPP